MLSGPLSLRHVGTSGFFQGSGAPIYLRARVGRALVCNTVRALRVSEVANDAWLSPIDRSGPYDSPELPEYDMVVPEALLETNPSTASSLGLSCIHLWWMFDENRELVAPVKRSWEGSETPQGRLYPHRTEYTGCLTPFILASKNQNSPYGLGSLTVLTPPIAVGDGTFEVMVATADHCLEPDNVHELCSRPEGFIPGQLPFTGLDPQYKPPTLKDVAGAEFFEAQSAIDAQGFPAPEPRASNAAYPPLQALDGLVSVKDVPGVRIFPLRLTPNKRGQVFPFMGGQLWELCFGFDFGVPTHEDPSQLTVVLTGFAGASFKQKAFVAGLGEEMRMAVASAGDVVGGGERYVFHRCSASGGLSGGMLRIVDRPQLLVGVHLGTNGGRSDVL
ncbi:hypothetical protein WJX73_009201 [Symbiochloris irregularis]|uniref:Uncharacterized protein n=1 Tax=Symbiochloris irregularis TaxID=706552 RepID=A0AAW1PST4_9CHLO